MAGQCGPGAREPRSRFPPPSPAALATSKDGARMTLRVPWRTSVTAAAEPHGKRCLTASCERQETAQVQAGQGPHVQFTRGALSRGSSERQAQDLGGPPETSREPPPAPLALGNLLTSQHPRRCAERSRWLHGTRHPQSSAQPCLQKESAVSPGQGSQPGPGSGRGRSDRNQGGRL